MEKALLFSDINGLDMIKTPYLDGFVMPLEHFSSYANRYFSVSDILFASRYKDDKVLIVRLDKIISEDEIASLKEVLEELSKEAIDYYMFTDFAVAECLKGKVSADKLIYANSKMLASKEECDMVSSFGYKFIPSTELTLDEIIELSTNPNSIINVFGYLNIFYSKRELITLYDDKCKRLFRRNRKNKIYFVKEEKREKFNPILENENGTFIFSSFVYSLYKELDNLKSRIFYINPFMFDAASTIEILKIFKCALINGISINDYAKLLDIAKDIGTGFLYLDSNILDEGVK